jgi:hypothetical protein
MTTPDYQAQAHADQLAALSQLDEVSLPREFLNMVATFKAAMELQPPALQPGTIGRATSDAALALVRRALDAKQPGVLPPLDTSAISHARAAERDALDEAALVAEVQAVATALLAKAARDQQGQIAAALQQRHREVMSELAEHARQLPEGISDQQALELGEPTRTHYLTARDLVAAAEQLRAALDDLAPRTTVPDDLERCVSFIRTGFVYQHGWLPRAGETIHGPLGSFEFYLGYGREVPAGDWWLPTQDQAQGQAGRLRQQWQADKIKAQPPGAYAVR